MGRRPSPASNPVRCGLDAASEAALSTRQLKVIPAQADAAMRFRGGRPDRGSSTLRFVMLLVARGFLSRPAAVA